MAYNHLKDKVKSFLKPYAESGQPVSADDIRDYFAKLRGDEEAIRVNGAAKVDAGNDEDLSSGGGKREQSGELFPCWLQAFVRKIADSVGA